MFRPLLFITALTFASLYVRAEAPSSTAPTPTEEVSTKAAPTPDELSFFSPKTEEDINKMATLSEADPELEPAGDE